MKAAQDILFLVYSRCTEEAGFSLSKHQYGHPVKAH